mmetsp:Transcript_130452/g.363463  ORF Transcript_130452/g.363463 Transcript_130452/m.363463 type:complete len:342 (-) Transcript_130452:428-1453(-)
MRWTPPGPPSKPYLGRTWLCTARMSSLRFFWNLNPLPSGNSAAMSSSALWNSGRAKPSSRSSCKERALSSVNSSSTDGSRRTSSSRPESARLTQPVSGPSPQSFWYCRRSPSMRSSLTMAPVARRWGSCVEVVAWPSRTRMPPLSAPPTIFQTWPPAPAGFRSHSFINGAAAVSAAKNGWPQSKSSLESHLPMRSTNFCMTGGGVILSLWLPQTSTGIWRSQILSHVLWFFLASSCLIAPSMRRGSSMPTFSSLVSSVYTICQLDGFFSFHSSVRSVFAWKIFLTTRSSTVTPSAYHSWIGKDMPPGPPVAQQHSTSFLTRCGWRIAKCWATIPPNDTPTT